LLRVLEDEDHRVRLSAAFGLYRLSASDEARLNYARLLADGLREGNPLVRRHAAMLLGMTGDTGATALLRYFFHDDDEWVEYQVAEAMALLGDDKALEQLVSYTFRANPLRQALALLALSRCGGTRAEEVLRYRLYNADYVEVQLAAAEGLGRMGYDDGLAAALNTLKHGRPDPNAPPQDTPANQLTRLELMASSALAQIRRREALPDLWRLLEYASRYPPDPAGVSTATAVLSTLRTDDPQTWSLARTRGSGRPAKAVP
jgi:HEAT repeat protein